MVFLFSAADQQFSHKGWWEEKQQEGEKCLAAAEGGRILCVYVHGVTEVSLPSTDRKKKEKTATRETNSPNKKERNVTCR